MATIPTAVRVVAMSDRRIFTEFLLADYGRLGLVKKFNSKRDREESCY